MEKWNKMAKALGKDILQCWHWDREGLSQPQMTGASRTGGCEWGDCLSGLLSLTLFLTAFQSYVSPPTSPDPHPTVSPTPPTPAFYLSLVNILSSSSKRDVLTRNSTSYNSLGENTGVTSQHPSFTWMWETFLYYISVPIIGHSTQKDKTCWKDG